MLLIGACIFTVIALAAIQGYFIYNTYQLTEKEITAKIKKQIMALEDTNEWYALHTSWMEEAGKFVKDYAFRRVKKEDFEKFMETKADSLSAVMGNYMAKNVHPDDYNIGYSIYITSATVTENKKTDSIYKGKLFVLGNKIKSPNETALSYGRWESSASEKISNTDKSYTFIIKSERHYSFADWQKTIIGKMAGLLIFSVILMAFVVYLYYMSLKNLISQKRIADIKTDFVNNITHEFQTPLATMDIAVKTLKRKDEQMSREHYANTLSMIERQNDRLQKLFRQVTEASVTPIANKENIQISCDEIREMIEDFKISKPGITIECRQEQEAFTIAMDRFHLNTIIINLLDNAVKYGANAIDIELKKSENTFLMTVSDNGKGIPFKEQDFIFDKFYRVEKGNIHNTKGLGLGLFYIKQLVETYKGRIRVESEEGKGAKFLISIPT